LGVSTTALVLGTVASASPGNGNDAVRVPIGNTPFDIGPQVCGFPIHVGVVADNEYIIHDTVLADGTEILQVAGKLVTSWTNEDTGKTIIENVSGPGTDTFFPDGSFIGDLHGNNAIDFYPDDQASTGEPGLVFFSGHAVLTFGPVGPAQSFTLSGTQTNGCALLAS